MVKKKAPIAAKQKQKSLSAIHRSLGSLDFSITSLFHGYRSKEDITNLPPGYLVSPSQNVIVNTSGLVQTRPGYTLDGQAGTSGNGILGSYDFPRGSYGDQHLRSGNSILQYRYVAGSGDKYKTNTFSNGQVFYIDLLASLNSNYVKFCNFFDTTELLNVTLFIQKNANIYEWSGAVTTLSSTGGSGPSSFTLTKTGTTTWAQAGFYVQKSGRAVVINGNTYTYTGGETTTTLTGVSGDPSAEPANSVVHQAIVTTSNKPASGLSNDIIGNLGNQIYVGSLTSNKIYLSKINDYTDYTQSTPRKPGDGYTASVDGLVNVIRSQETTMYVSWGISGWTTIEFKLSADLTAEAVTFTPLKVAPLQGALSDGLTCNIGNDLAFVTNEPTISTLGRVAQVITTPQITNISDSIKIDIDGYGTSNFADGQIIYTKYFIYLSVPKLGIVRKYNINEGWWEPPFILPVGRFSIISGNVYGHSYLNDETYHLENGTNDNGQPIHAIAAFSYENFEDRITKKNFGEFGVEGYIAANTFLTAIRKFDFGAFNGIASNIIGGNNTVDGVLLTDSQNIIFQTTADGSLGKNPLANQPIGSITDSLLNLPKFRVILTSIPQNFYEYQAYFESNDVDQQWAILALGPRIQKSANDSTEIKY